MHEYDWLAGRIASDKRYKWLKSKLVMEALRQILFAKQK